MIKPALDEAKILAEGNTVIPIAMEMYSDVKTSVEILRNIRSRSDRFYILESVTGSDSWGRYSFLGYNPTVTVRGRDGSITIQNGGAPTVREGSPMEVLREMLGRYKSPRIPYLPPFTGGFVGYFAYDCVKYFIPTLTLNAADKEDFDDFHLMLMDKVIAFDHFRQKIYLVVNISTDDLENNYIKGVTTLKDMERMILSETPPEPPRENSCGAFTSAFSKEQYCAMVDKAKAHILEGDIFQVVLSNRYEAPFQGDLLETYRILRTTNPSPYMVYFHFGDMEIAGASPETLISLKDGVVSTFPLAGTCTRGKTEEEDKALIAALLADSKEGAEHDMLVDLGRNDLGRISEYGSVELTQYQLIHKYSRIMHICSQVEGNIRADADGLDAIAAVLPAGTLSGAPKIRAAEIIEEMETEPRGIYGGALGYIDFTGNLDTCIAIRMAMKKDGYVYVQSGGGIVADSVPEAEYEESYNKAAAVISAIEQAGEVDL